MKNFMFAIVVTLPLTFTANAAIYDCRGGSFDPVKLDISYTAEVIINDADFGIANYVDVQLPTKNEVKLIGDFKTLGNGAEGYSVDVRIAKKMLGSGSNVGYLDTHNKGPDGYFSESYSCIKR